VYTLYMGVRTIYTRIYTPLGYLGVGTLEYAHQYIGCVLLVHPIYGCAYYLHSYLLSSRIFGGGHSGVRTPIYRVCLFGTPYIWVCVLFTLVFTLLQDIWGCVGYTKEPCILTCRTFKRALYSMGGRTIYTRIHSPPGGYFGVGTLEYAPPNVLKECKLCLLSEYRALLSEYGALLYTLYMGVRTIYTPKYPERVHLRSFCQNTGLFYISYTYGHLYIGCTQ